MEDTMKRALAVLLFMSLGLGGCIYGPGGYRGDGYNHGDDRGQDDRGDRGDRGEHRDRGR